MKYFTKKSTGFSFACLVGLVSTLSGINGYPAYALEPQPNERVEIPVEKVFAPIDGYEDSNSVDVVLHGFLPNGCYVLADTFYEELPDGLTIALHQYARHIKSGICADTNHLPAQLNTSIPFNNIVSIEHLNAAPYTLQYQSALGSQKRELHVTVATAPTIDSLPYAIVSNVVLPDVVRTTDEVQVSITGVFNSRCTALDNEVKILREKDVFVLLPTIHVLKDTPCDSTLVPFTRTINLGRMDVGTYLIHTRSMNGQSVNRVIIVTPEDGYAAS